MRSLLFLLALLLGSALTSRADIACDGIDDDLRSNLTMDTFLSASTGSIHFWYKPTGVANNNGSTACYGGGLLLGFYEADVGLWSGVTRHSNYQGLDQLTGYHYDAADNCTSTLYTVNAWTPLAWVHDGGTLTLYKDGVAVDSTPAGLTGSLAGKFHVCMGLAFELQGIVLGAGTITAVEIFSTALSPLEIRTKAAARLHHFGATRRSGAWSLDGCSTTGEGISFFDSSGNGHHLVGNDGASNTGLTCLGNTLLTYAWGAE